MKRLAFFTLAILFACCSCNSPRRAARRITRIAERHPELVAPQAHPIDTLLAVPSIADSVSVPLAPLLSGNAVVITTRQGTFTANIVRAEADSLNITYQADIEPIRYADTIQYAQIVVSEKNRSEGRHSCEGRNGNLLAIAAIVLIASFLVLIFRICNRNR